MLCPVVLEQFFVFEFVVDFCTGEVAVEAEGGLFNCGLLGAGDGFVGVWESVLDEAGFGSHWRIVTEEMLVAFKFGFDAAFWVETIDGRDDGFGEL